MTKGPLQEEVRDTSRTEKRVVTGRCNGSGKTKWNISGKEF